jgi:hypothetical protein
MSRSRPILFDLFLRWIAVESDLHYVSDKPFGRGPRTHHSTRLDCCEIDNVVLADGCAETVV